MLNREGEDDKIDLLIRKYGYRTTPETMVDWAAMVDDLNQAGFCEGER